MDATHVRASALRGRQASVKASTLPAAHVPRPLALEPEEAYAWLTVLRIQLLGRMTVECDGEELAAPSARRAWSLLAYLALSPGPQSRGDLAAHFWPDVLDASARASLRSAVWSLRRILGPAADAYLIVDRNWVGLAPDPGAVGGRR